MKTKTLFIILVGLSFSYKAFSQTVAYGPRLGLNFATYRAMGGDKGAREIINDELESYTGLQAGAVLNVEVNDQLSFQPELLFSQKGFRTGRDLFGVSGVRKAHYLEVPLLAKYALGEGNMQAFATAGPYLGYWVGGKEKVEVGDTEVSEAIDFDDDRLNRLDLGGSLGLGLACKAGPGAFNLDVRYGVGLSDTHQYSERRNRDTPKICNRVLGVSLAYLFGGR